jgi:hypothetical protein
MAARCPHCGKDLPEAAAFCAACGRRIEGWSKAPQASDGAALVDGDMLTRRMDVKPGELRKPTTTGPVETDSMLMRAYKRARWPIGVALVLLGGGAGVFAYFMVRKQAAEPSTVAPPPAAVAVAPAQAPAPGPAPSAPRDSRAKPHKRAARIEPMTLTKDGIVMPAKPAAAADHAASKPKPAETKSDAPKPSKQSGGLPHKTVATDSKSSAPATPVSTAGVQTAAADAPEESAPLTEAEMKSRAEASIDADGVRFVVKAHLPQVHACYERAFKDSSPGGQVEIGFAVATDGKAVRVRTESNSTDSEMLAKCLESRVREWQFPRPVGGEVELIYPFVFSKGS